MLLIPIVLLFTIGVFFLTLKLIIPYRENIRKETYKKALQEYETEKRKESGN